MTLHPQKGRHCGAEWNGLCIPACYLGFQKEWIWKVLVWFNDTSRFCPTLCVKRISWLSVAKQLFTQWGWGPWGSIKCEPFLGLAHSLLRYGILAADYMSLSEDATYSSSSGPGLGQHQAWDPGSQLPSWHGVSIHTRRGVSGWGLSLVYLCT